MEYVLMVWTLAMTNYSKVEYSQPYKYQLEYVGTKVKAYTNSYNFNEVREDIKVYRLVNGKYEAINK